jgi:prepilin-type N-terminal cleavage/methylation domain-containing protein
VSRRGFSLFEVILALAILGGAIAVLGEGARLAMRNAQYAREMATAQMLCESKMSEIVAGLVAADPVQRAVLKNAVGDDEPAWLYSVETASIDENGLRSVQVTVRRDLPAEQHPAEFSLVRWIAPEPKQPENAESTTTQP